MLRYKTIAGPTELQIDKKGSYEAAVSTFADIIQREANAGWEFVSIQEIQVRKSKGCLASLLSIFGITSPYEYLSVNMLIFKQNS